MNWNSSIFSIIINKSSNGNVSNQIFFLQYWWLILCVYLPGLRGVHAAGKTLFLGVVWGCFHILVFESVEWVKICPHQSGWASSNQLRTLVEQKGRGRANFFLSLLELGSPFSNALKWRSSSVPGLKVQAESQHLLPWVSSHSQQTLGLLSLRSTCCFSCSSVAQPCLTVRDPMDYSMPGFSQFL